LNLYEFMYIIDSSIGEEQIDAEIGTILDDIREKGGEIISTRDMGTRQLAYPINKCEDGKYLLAYIKIDGKALDAVKAKYKLDSRIVRYLILRIKEEQMIVPREET